MGWRGLRVAVALIVAVVVIAAWRWLAPAPHDPPSPPVQLPSAAASAGMPVVGATPLPMGVEVVPREVQERIRKLARLPGAIVETATTGDPAARARCGTLRRAPGEPPRRFVWIDAAGLLAIDDGRADFALLAQKACGGIR